MCPGSNVARRSPCGRCARKSSVTTTPPIGIYVTAGYSRKSVPSSASVSFFTMREGIHERHMLAYSVRRLLLIIPVMLVVATTVFLLLYLTPGDPVGIILGADATEQQKAELRAQLGLDQPAYVQLMRWYLRLLQGDLGTSIFLNKEVTTAFLERLEPTVMLTLLALAFAVIIGLPAGICAAKMRGSWFDMASMLIAIAGVSMRTFWVGLNLICILAVSPGWLASRRSQPLP